MGRGKKGAIPPQQRGAPVIPKYVPKPKQFTPVVGDGNLRVRFNSVDVDGPWCVSKIEAAHHIDLLQRLKSFESMKCSEVFKPGSDEGIVYSVPDIPNKEARNRLVELQFDDQTEIARLRISGRRRLYGFLPNLGPDFYVLWWDPEHEIWPSTLKHT